jgi:hypothetical protein
MLPDRFEIDGVGYEVDQCGVIVQTPPTITQVYDREYVASRYDALPDHGRQMSLLRAGYLVGALKHFLTVLDVGYGNGDFLKVWSLWPEWNVKVAGYDVGEYPTPEGIERISEDDISRRRFDLVTFFDSLEHMGTLDLLAGLQTKYVAITVPWCHADRLGTDWFRGWRHRRPGEHVRHFSPRSLTELMYSLGYELMVKQSIEDAIRRPTNSHENTFTAVYRRQWMGCR